MKNSPCARPDFDNCWNVCIASLAHRFMFKMFRDKSMFHLVYRLVPRLTKMFVPRMRQCAVANGRCVWAEMESHASCPFSGNSGCQVQTGVFKTKISHYISKCIKYPKQRDFRCPKAVEELGNTKVSTKDSQRFSCAGKK